MSSEKRGANFMKSEIDLLIDIVLKYKHVVENKKTDATSCQDKNEAWDKISHEFNAASGNFLRSTKTIRSKYDTIKKNIRKKCSFLKSEQTKTGGGQWTGTLTPGEEKILSLTPNTMIGFRSRFDDDAMDLEAGPSRAIQHIEDPEIGVAEDGIIEFVNNGDKDLLQYLKAESQKESLLAPINEEKITEGSTASKIGEVDSTGHNKRRSGTDTKFIFKKKRSKTSLWSTRIVMENSQLKIEILVLQKEMLLQEVNAKKVISDLTVENLKLDLQIKKLTVQKLLSE